jgi:hypothetical protein
VRKQHREKGVLTYPQHQLKPEDALDFIEMEGWARDCKKLGLSELDLGALRVCIMSGPDRAPMIRGTGGVRKARFAPSSWAAGKRGAARICYAYFKQYSLVLLIKAYSKNEKASLSAAEKTSLRTAMQTIKRELSRKPIS